MQHQSWALGAGCAVGRPAGGLLLHLAAAGKRPTGCTAGGPAARTGVAGQEAVVREQGPVAEQGPGAWIGAAGGPAGGPAARTGVAGSCWGCCSHHVGSHGYRRWIRRCVSEAVVAHFYGLGYVFEPLYLKKKIQKESEKLKIQNQLGRCVYL
ncbi:hypothetical protein V6N13_092294 [Hibiscus sabdariffa]|uniref:Uncharacterized protein n=1 Tax=Hibiscus sabdariffa TaxID=183260 RepID=A0ABR2CBZ0_9ROSI